jgi:hypothetical protein
MVKGNSDDGFSIQTFYLFCACGERLCFGIDLAGL